jgi:small subunit ribosomal protein S16
MAVVIRMMRAGAKKRPFYRIVVADSRRQRDGRFVEILGYYDPMAKPWAVKMDEEKVKGWIAQGAQPSTQAASIFRRVGIIAARPSKSTKKKATMSAAGAAKKKAVKRARPRKVTARKTRAKATRAKRKANPKPKPAVAAKA